MNVNKDAMRSLGLNYELATGQLVDRDRYVEFIEILVNLSSALFVRSLSCHVIAPSISGTANDLIILERLHTFRNF